MNVNYNYCSYLIVVLRFPCLTRKALCAFRRRKETDYMYIRQALNRHHMKSRKVKIGRRIIEFLTITVQGVEYLKLAFPDSDWLQSIDTQSRPAIVGSGHSPEDLYRWSRMSMACLAIDVALGELIHSTVFPNSIFYGLFNSMYSPDTPYKGTYIYPATELKKKYPLKGKQPIRNVGLAIISNLDAMYNIYVWDIRGMRWSEKATSSEKLLPGMPLFKSKLKSGFSFRGGYPNAIMFIQNEKCFSDFFFDAAHKNRDKDGCLFAVPYYYMVIIPYCFDGLKIVRWLLSDHINALNEHLLNSWRNGYKFDPPLENNTMPYPYNVAQQFLPVSFKGLPVFFGFVMDLRTLIDLLCLGPSRYFILCGQFQVSYYRRILDISDDRISIYDAPTSTNSLFGNKWALMYVDMQQQPAELLEHLKLLKPRRRPI